MKLFAVGVLAVLGSGYTIAQIGQSEKRVKLSTDAPVEGIVTILIPNGEIRIEGWRKNEIEVTGSIDNEDSDVTLSSDHGHAELSLADYDGTVHVNLRVRLPYRSNLDVETLTANVAVAEIAGMLRFESIDGSLTVSGTPRGVVARSTTGNIDIPAANIPGFVHSEDGTVRLGSRTGTVAANRMARLHRQDNGRSHHHFEHFGEDLSDFVHETLRTIDIEGLVDYDELGEQLRFDLTGRLYLDLDDLGDVLADMGDMLEDLDEELEDQIEEEMDRLEEELDRLADDLHDKDHRRRK